MLAPLFIAVIGNLDGFAQVARKLAEQGQARPGGAEADGALAAVAVLPDAVVGLGSALTGRAPLPAYDFWAPSRVIPHTINEFPYWSFLFADLHPHVIGIPLALLFCALLLALLSTQRNGWRVLLPVLAAMGFLLGALSSVNLWELPTYLGLGILGLAVHQFRSHGRVHPLAVATGGAIYAGVAVVTFLPFFRNYANVGASGIGLVREPDPLGTWLSIWGLFLFVIASWLAYATALRPARTVSPGPAYAPTGDERAYSLALREYDRLPRMVYLHRLLVRKPTFGYLFGLSLIPVCLLAAVALAVLGYGVLGLCVALLGPAWMLLWKRGTDSDPAALLIALLSFASLAILAGTQVVFLRDFLQGGEWYRMNTLFKFFIQVWLLLGLAAAIAVPRLWRALLHPVKRPDADGAAEQRSWVRRAFAVGWASVLALLVLASLSFTAFGTPARLSQRLNGWRPAFGTLERDGLHAPGRV